MINQELCIVGQSSLSFKPLKKRDKSLKIGKGNQQTLSYSGPILKRNYIEPSCRSQIGLFNQLPNLSDKAKLKPSHTISKFDSQYSGSLEQKVDKLLISAFDKDISDCIELFFATELHATSVIYWEDIPTVHMFFSRRLQKIIPHSDGIIGFTFYQRTATVFDDPETHPSYNQAIDGQFPRDQYVLIFPLWNDQSSICSIVEVVRPKALKGEYDDDLSLVQYFQDKFRVFSTILFKSKFPFEPILELLQSLDLTQFLLIFQKKMENIFHCRVAEIWVLDNNLKKINRYIKSCSTVPISNAGIMGEVLTKGYPLNAVSNKMQSSFLEKVDGSEMEPILAISSTNVSTNSVTGVILRGGSKVPIFTSENEKILKQILPYIILSLSNVLTVNSKNKSISSESNTTHFVNALSSTFEKIALLNQSILSSYSNEPNRALSSSKPSEEDGAVLDQILHDLVDYMMLISKADRVILYVSKADQRNSLISKASTCKLDCELHPTSRTFPALAFISNSIYNVEKAYEDKDFDNSLDIATGYRTSSILVVPLLSLHGYPIGAVELTNKIDGKPFTGEDIRIIKLLSVIAGAFVERNNLRLAASEASEKLRSEISKSLALIDGKKLQESIMDVLKGLIINSHAESAGIYLKDTNRGALVALLSIGPIQACYSLIHGAPATCVKTLEPIFSDDVQNDIRFSNDPNYSLSLHSFCVIPILSSKQECVGVVILLNKNQNSSKKLKSSSNSDDLLVSQKDLSERQKVLRNDKMAQNEMTNSILVEQSSNSFVEDIPAMSSLSSLIQIVLEGRSLEALGEHGNPSFELERLFKDNEKEIFEIPELLKLSKLKQLEANSLEFSSYNSSWCGVNSIKLIFYIFDSLKFLKTFKITAKKLFLFIYNIREVYTNSDVPFHNWNHACDSLQFLALMLKGTEIEYKIPPEEQLALCVATLAIHFVPYELNPNPNRYETLRKVADSSDIFSSFAADDQKKEWKLILELVNYADPVCQFDLLDEAKPLSEVGVNYADNNCRDIFIRLMMRASQLSFMCRPSDICSKWYNAMSSEGGKVRKNVFTTDEKCPENDKRIVLESAKEKIAFADLIALPIFHVLAKFDSHFSDIEDGAKRNFIEWLQLFDKRKSLL